MKPTTAKLLLGAFLTTAPAMALDLMTFDSSLSVANPSQFGRLVRGGLPQDWSGGEAFPGVNNSGTSFHYDTFLVNVGNTPYIQVEMDSTSGNTFISAYDTSYLPGSAGLPNLGLDVNWLGDAGFSGNAFGVDAVFFQVLVPANHNLVIVVNQTAAGASGLGDPFHILVEGFIDSAFTDPAPVPESTASFVGLGGLAILMVGLKCQSRRNIAPILPGQQS